MIEGYTFDGQPYPAAEFAETVKALLNKNEGILSGIELSNTTNSITVSSGKIIIQGRQFAVKGEETIEVESLQTGEIYCSLVFEIDMDKEDSSSNFDQVHVKVITSASGYPLLTQQDINNGKQIYQFEIARFKNSSSGIKQFEDKRNFLNLNDIYEAMQTEYRTVLNQLKNELENVEDGSAYMLKNQFITLYGTIEMPEANSGSLNGSLIFNYPEGFTKDNCVVISLMSHNTVNEDRWSTPISSQHSSVALLGNGDTEVILETDNIRIMSFKNDDAMPRNDVSFKITLMKLPVPEYTLGDVNDDGVIDEADYEIVKDYIMGNRVLTDKEFKAADMNNDYKINSGDTFLLIQKINGIE